MSLEFKCPTSIRCYFLELTTIQCIEMPEKAEFLYSRVLPPYEEVNSSHSIATFWLVQGKCKDKARQFLIFGTHGEFEGDGIYLRHLESMPIYRPDKIIEIVSLFQMTNKVPI